MSEGPRMVSSDYLRDAEVMVIGAGAVGAALSYRLAQAGARVTIVERMYPGAGTTGNSFGYINGTSKTPRSYQRLNVMSVRDHQDLADELDADWVHVGGSLHWADANDGAKLERLRGTMRQLRSWGMRIDSLEPEQVMRELEPDLWIDPEAVPEVYRVDRAGWLDCVAMAHGTVKAAVRRYGARLLHASLVSMHRKGDLIDAVSLDNGEEFGPDVVINCAGADAGHIAALADVRLPLERTPGLLMTTAPAPVCLHHVVYSAQGNLRPDGGARLMIQREELDVLAVKDHPLSSDDPAIADAMDRVRGVVPGLRDIPVEAVRLGVRPMPKDGLSIVGFDLVVGNLYHVVTHSGITLAARLALLITEELTGGDTSQLEPYRLGRFESPDGAGHPRPAAVGLGE